MMIYCVEDDKNIRDLIVYAMGNSGMECRGFEDAESLYLGIDNLLPDLFLVDVMLPGEDGISILKQLRKNTETRSIPVIMVTAKGSEYDKIQGLDLGADDYVTKPFSVLELISRVKAVMRRVKPQGGGTLSEGEIQLHPQSHRVFVKEQEVILTNKEFQLLQFLMENHGLVLSRDTLLTRVWGYDYQGETRTVDVHVRSLRQKLGSEGDRIETVRGVGYRVGGSL